jgi:hypothetical protein
MTGGAITSAVPADSFTYDPAAGAAKVVHVEPQPSTKVASAKIPALVSASAQGFNPNNIVSSIVASLGSAIQGQAQNLANQAVSLIPSSVACPGPVNKAAVKEVIHGALASAMSVATRSIVGSAPSRWRTSAANSGWRFRHPSDRVPSVERRFAGPQLCPHADCSVTVSCRSNVSRWWFSLESALFS